MYSRPILFSVLLLDVLNVAHGAFLIRFGQLRNVYRATKWPSTDISFTIDKSLTKYPNETVQVYRAIRHLEANSCLRFNEKKNGSILFARIEKERCMGTVGQQQYNYVYGYWRCWRKIGYILHEILHNLGFLHEHQRPDRDEHIQILYDNIEEHRRSLFEKRDLDWNTYYGTAYDPYSVMHYEPTLFTINSNVTTMVPTGRSLHMDDIGHKERGLSTGDILTINNIYCGFK